MKRSTLPGPATRKIIITTAEGDITNMSRERFEALRSVIRDRYGEAWAKDWETMNIFREEEKPLKKCAHEKFELLEPLVHEQLLCRDCHGVVLTCSELTERECGDVVRRLERRRGRWDYRWIINDKELEIPCRHKRVEILDNGDLVCMGCDEINPERVPPFRSYHRSVSVEKELKHLQGQDKTPKFRPKILKALRGITTKKDIRDVLTRIGQTKLLKHIHHLHHEITGVPKNNIKDLEDILTKEIVEICEESGIVDDKEHLLMLLLEAHGEDFDRSEFKEFSKKTLDLEEHIMDLIS